MARPSILPSVSMSVSVSVLVSACVSMSMCVCLCVCVSASDSVSTCLCVCVLCVSVLECLCVVCVYHSPPTCHFKFRPHPLLAEGCSFIHPAHTLNSAPTHPYTVESINRRTFTHAHTHHTHLSSIVSLCHGLSLSLSLSRACAHALSLPSYIHSACLSLYVRLSKLM